MPAAVRGGSDAAGVPEGRCGGRALSPEEDQALRQTFGRFAVPAARPAGAAVARRYQHAGPGHWLAYPCCGPGGPPPVLVPVAETHVRRHVEGDWPEHAVWCDFYREPQDRAAVSASHRCQAEGGTTLSLVRGYGSGRDLEQALSGSSREHRRPRLARVLFELKKTERLNRVEGESSLTIAAQFGALRTAAAGWWLEEGASLARYLCTYLLALPEFAAPIAQTPPSRCGRTGRPHGLLIGVAKDAGLGQIRPGSGELDGHAAGCHATTGARAP